MTKKKTPPISAKLAHSDPITNIPMVGKKYAERLENLGIEIVQDLIFHFPHRYQDTRNIQNIEQIKEAGEGTISAEVQSIRNIRSRRGKMMTTAQVLDESGSLSVLWFNQPYLAKTIKVGKQYLLHGKVSNKWGRYTLMNPQYEAVGDSENEQVHLAKLSPIYPETKGVSSKWLRARIKTLEPMIGELVEEFLPEEIVKSEKLLELPKSVRKVHFPEDEEDVLEARERLALNELMRIQVDAQKFFEKRKGLISYKVDADRKKAEVGELIGGLDYELTGAQERAIDEILEDLVGSMPMTRLLNGDVGSGKTIVAVAAAVAAYAEGYTTVFMAPTTILARQHYENIKKTLKNSKPNIEPKLVTSSEKHDFDPGKPQIIIGTHAILYQDKLPEKIALVIIDEQHRFGVEQREKLALATSSIDESGKKIIPHYLSMTATPIPRTLTMAIYGTTQVSVLDELPAGRKPIVTRLVPDSKRKSAYRWIAEKLDRDEQAFVICPLVEESENFEAKSAKLEYQRLSQKVFKNHKVGMVHGQLSEEEKNKILREFKDGKFDILVATPVIEVGIDIPNATIMIIEDAERFGLAQLHQFRGRIGRGDKESFCFLFSNAESELAIERLKFFSKNTDGFKIAEYDLESRGPGEVYGIRQSGILNLRFANLSDAKMIEKARRIVEKLGADKIEKAINAKKT